MPDVNVEAAEEASHSIEGAEDVERVGVKAGERTVTTEAGKKVTDAETQIAADAAANEALTGSQDELSILGQDLGDEGKSLEELKEGLNKETLNTLKKSKFFDSFENKDVKFSKEDVEELENVSDELKEAKEDCNKNCAGENGIKLREARKKFNETLERITKDKNGDIKKLELEPVTAMDMFKKGFFERVRKFFFIALGSAIFIGLGFLVSFIIKSTAKSSAVKGNQIIKGISSKTAQSPEQQNEERIKNLPKFDKLKLVAILLGIVEICIIILAIFVIKKNILMVITGGTLLNLIIIISLFNTYGIL